MQVTIRSGTGGCEATSVAATFEEGETHIHFKVKEEDGEESEILHVSIPHRVTQALYLLVDEDGIFLAEGRKAYSV